jgi:Domain of unknown function (DUF4178)
MSEDTLPQPVPAKPAKSTPRALTCPQCGGSIEVRAAGNSVTVACQYCGSLLDVAQGDAALIAAWHGAVAQLPLPIGSRGQIEGAEFEVIGWVEREAEGWRWGEYCLFNPYAGYRWLVNSGEAWQLGRTLIDLPGEGGANRVQWHGATYTCEDPPVEIVTTRVLGEFYWRVHAGESWHAMSFEAGPQALSQEWNESESQWTHLRPATQAEMASFAIPKGAAAEPTALATPQEVAPELAEVVEPRRSLWQRWCDRPWRGGNDIWWMLALAMLTTLIAFIILAIAGSYGKAQEVRLSLPGDGVEKQANLGPITVLRPEQFVTINAASSAFVNRWVDLDYALVNRATHQAIPAEATIEYYKGHDSDGDWSEGGHNKITLVAQVPRGQYDLMVSAEAHSWQDPAVSAPSTAGSGASAWSGGDGATGSGEAVELAVQAETGGMPWGWLWTISALAFAWPVVVLLAKIKWM